MQGSLVREAAVADTGPPFLNVKSGVDLGNMRCRKGGAGRMRC